MTLNTHKEMSFLKVATLFFTFFSIPMLAFAASQKPGNLSFSKIVGGLSGNIILVLLGATLLRFGAKRYLKAFHSRQHSSLKEAAQKVIRYHQHFSLSALVLIFIHGIAMYISRNLWNAQMLLGIISFSLFALTFYFGFLINKRRLQRQLFYTLHMSTLVLAICIGIIHIQYKPFIRLFL